MLLRTLFWTNCIAVVSIGNTLFAQSDSIVSRSTKLNKTVSLGLLGGAAIGTHAALYSTWYSKTDKSKFHWFNDNQEWLQMDKVGHAWSTYALSEIGYKMLSYGGYTPKQAQNLSLVTALAFQFTIEYFDGKSKKWGASWGDLAANTAGGLWSYGQRKLWNRVKIPFGFTPGFSPYAQIRPAVLGSNLPTRVLKDYNGQIYWLSFIPNNWVPNSKWPKWLGFSVGYGADGMVGGFSNVYVSNGITYDYSNIPRFRQYYFSPRLTLSHIKTKKKWVNTLCKATDFVRIPLPTLLYSQQQFRGRWLSL